MMIERRGADRASSERERSFATVARRCFVLLGAFVLMLLIGRSASAEASTYTAAVLADSPSVYYRLDESSGPTAFDSSGNSINGTYFSSEITYGVAGALLSDPDKAASFAAGGTVTADGSTLPHFPAQAAYELWFRSTASNFDLLGAPEIGISYSDGLGSGIPQIGIQGAASANLSRPFNDGVWHLLDVVAIFRPGGDDRFDVYIDGAYESSTMAPDHDRAGTSLMIGDGGFYGAASGIDEVAVYPGSLSPARISAHWTAGDSRSSSACPSPPSFPYTQAVLKDGPVSYLRLDDLAADPSSRVAFDSSPTCADSALGPDNGSYSAQGVGLQPNGPLTDGTAAISFTEATATVRQSPVGLPPDPTHPGTYELWFRSTAAGFDLLDAPAVGISYATQGTQPAISLRSAHLGLGVPLSSGFNDGHWHLLDVVDYGGTVGQPISFDVYMDGAHQGPSPSTNDGGDTRGGGGGLTLGNPPRTERSYGGPSGDMAEVAIYPTALSASQIAAHYTAGITPIPPSVVTGSASGLTPTTGTLNGTVNPNGIAVSDCHFDYGQSTAYGSSLPCAQMVGKGTSPMAVSAQLANLTENTTYHFRLVAANKNATADGQDETFKTPTPGPPIVSTGAASGVTLTSAQLNGSVAPSGFALSDCHFDYGIGAFTQHVQCPLVAGSGFDPVPVSAAVSGLQAGATYQFRLVAANALGPTVGNTETFETCDSTEVKKPPLDATGCFAKGPRGTWIGSGAVRVNGIDFQPSSGGQVSIDPAGLSVTLTGSGKVVIGGVLPVQGWTTTTTYNLGGTINLVPGASGNLHGFPITGALTAKLSEGDESSGGEATITGTVTLTALGDPVTAALSVTTSNADGIAGASFRVMPANADNNYFELSPCKQSKRPPLGFTCESVESPKGHAYTGLIAKEPGVVKLLGFLPIEGMSGSYDRSTDIWSITAALALKDALPGGGFITGKVPTLTLGLTFHGSRLVGGQLGDSDIAVDVGAAVIDDFSFHAQFYPHISLGGDVSLRAGPGKQAIQISAGADAEQGAKSGWDLKAHGDFTLQHEVSIGGSVEYDGRDGGNAISISGTFSKSIGPINFAATLGGGIGNRHYQINGSGILTAFGLADLGLKGIFSDAGWGVCATVHAFIFSGDFGVKHLWGGDYDWNSGCDFSGLYTVNSGPAADLAAAAATGQRIVLRRGLGREEIGVVGTTAPPNVTLTAPGGVTLSTPATPDRFQPFGHSGYALAVTSSKTTWFILTKPHSGRWSVSAAAGSSPIARIERADPLTKPAIRAAVTGRGARRTLTWRLAPQHGVTVRFAQADGTEPTIAIAGTRRHGRARFAVVASKPGLRRIVAVLLVDGFPRSMQTVATFRVAATPAPRVTHARYRLRRRALTVSWRRAPGAARYELDVRLSSGLLRWFVSDRSTRTTVKPPAGRVRSVTLIATDAAGRVGPHVRVRRLPHGRRSHKR